MTTPNYGQPVHGSGQPQYEIGLDGKPYEVFPAAPQQQGAPMQQAAPVYQAAPQMNHYQTSYGVGGNAPVGRAETDVLTSRRVSMERNNLAWAALGLGLAALILQSIHLAFAEGTSGLLTFFMIVASAYFGMRAHNAGVNGFATNAKVAHIGMILAALALAGYVLVPIAYAAYSFN